MKVYVDSWKGSKHREVGCIECHYKPGFLNHLKGKWQDGQISMVYFVTGKSPTKPHAEIDDSSCLQSKCHSKNDLRKDVVFKNVVFNHAKHLEQMKREKQLRCTTCHSQIVQGAHITVTDVECFICHFYKAKGQKEYVTGCTSCHFEAKGDIKVNVSFDFNHRLYMDRKIKCETCHRNVITGDGRIQENSCLKCHNKREILEARHTPESLHKNHVTDHKVECFECHSAITHKIVPLRYTGQEPGACSNCHKPEVHADKVLMYRGKGARFVEDQPNRMALVNLDCDICHRPGAGKAGIEGACKDCHASFTDGMVERWRKILKEKTGELQKEIAETKAAAEMGQGANLLKGLLGDALFNEQYLQKGDGIHNIVHALKILETTKGRLQEARAKVRATSFKAVPFKTSCTYMCHGNVQDMKVPFGAITFPHEVHAEGEASCQKCHTSYADHGKTALKGCSECHHGEGMGKATCKDCHGKVDRVLRAKGAIHGKAACADCHKAIKTTKKEKSGSIGVSCTKCHKENRTAALDDWLRSEKETTSRLIAEKGVIEREIDAIEAKDGKHSVPLRKTYDIISGDIALLQAGRSVHNPPFSEELVRKIGNDVKKLRAMIKQKQAGKPIILE